MPPAALHLRAAHRTPCTRDPQTKALARAVPGACDTEHQCSAGAPHPPPSPLLQGFPGRLYHGAGTGAVCVFLHRLVCVLLQDGMRLWQQSSLKRRVGIQIVSFIAAVLVYPLDTVKRHVPPLRLQPVHNAVGPGSRLSFLSRRTLVASVPETSNYFFGGAGT